MYYSNLNNPELNKFHNKTLVEKDFFDNETLLTSDIWQHENMGNGFYKSFPLVYCETITSTNKEDRIFTNRMIIWDSNKERTITLLSKNNITDLKDIIFNFEVINEVIILSFYNKFNLDAYNHITLKICDEEKIDKTTLENTDYIEITSDGSYDFNNVNQNSFTNQAVSDYTEIDMNNQNSTIIPIDGYWFEVSFENNNYLILITGGE